MRPWWWGIEAKIIIDDANSTGAFFPTVILSRNNKKWRIVFYCPSFHVGSGCADPEAFVQAISDARCVFDMGVSTCRPQWWGAGLTVMVPVLESTFCRSHLVLQRFRPTYCTFFMTRHKSGCLIDLIFLTLGRGWFQHVSA